jgi:hypothetical protein
MLTCNTFYNLPVRPYGQRPIQRILSQLLDFKQLVTTLLATPRTSFPASAHETLYSIFGRSPCIRFANRWSTLLMCHTLQCDTHTHKIDAILTKWDVNPALGMNWWLLSPNFSPKSSLYCLLYHFPLSINHCCLTKDWLLSDWMRAGPANLLGGLPPSRFDWSGSSGVRLTTHMVGLPCVSSRSRLARTDTFEQVSMTNYCIESSVWTKTVCLSLADDLRTPLSVDAQVNWELIILNSFECFNSSITYLQLLLFIFQRQSCPPIHTQIARTNSQ